MAKKTVANGDFEDKLKELEGLIEQIESGKEGLNTSVEKYAYAQDLATQLEKILKGVKDSVEASDIEKKEDIEEEE